MKESIVLYAGLYIALVFTGYKLGESIYKEAYEKVRVQKSVQISAQTEVSVVAPLIPALVTQTQVVDNVSNATVRTEDATMMSGSDSSAFSVVVGSFGLKANTEGLWHMLQSVGYETRIAYNSTRNMHCTVATTHADKVSAVASCNQFRSEYPDAWLLYKK